MENTRQLNSHGASLQTDRLKGGLETLEGERGKERAGRIEPFRRPTGVGSVLAVIDLKHQLVMRPPHPEVPSGLWEHCPTIAHPPAVCFGCLPAWLAWLPSDCRRGLGCLDVGREAGIRTGIRVACVRVFRAQCLVIRYHYSGLLFLPADTLSREAVCHGKHLLYLYYYP